MSAPIAWTPARAAEIILSLKHLDGACLPILRAIQAEFGHVPPEAVAMVADALNLSRAEVHGTFSFYHDLRAEPAGRTVVKLCRAEACQAMGGDALAERAMRKIGVDWHGTTADGRVTLEPAFCLGLCSTAPAAMVGERVVGRLDETTLGRLLDAAP
ncbi:MAG: formate dehydrogenase subunit gamma [Alphaproteobacteria bacterium]|nr:formate dehydrogenase subunit gamma [Alphaproteobacteria bacterium]